MNIEVKNLSKFYNSQKVLNIENLSIKQGMTAILGQNGCGKTTLLNILSGHLKYDSGSITYNDKLYTKNIAKDITLVSQKPYLLNRSVYENIAYPLKVRKYNNKYIKENVESIIKKLRITELQNKKGLKLSGGEMQKVALARAIIFKPDLLMLDEATSNIDKQSMGLIEDIIYEYAEKNKTVLFVTHDYCQAKKLTDRLIQL